MTVSINSSVAGGGSGGGSAGGPSSYSQRGTAITLGATSTGQRQAVGGAQQLSLTCAAGCALYFRFSDATAAIAVSTSDVPVVLSTTASVVNVPAGYPFFEYVLASSTASVVLSMLA